MTYDDRCRRIRNDTPENAANTSSLVFEDSGRRSERLDELFKVLSNHRRRYALYHLTERSATDLDSLLASIAAKEVEESEESDLQERIDRLAVEFHHVHLPMLEDAGLVDYDARSDAIRYRGRATARDSLLKII